MERGAPFDWQRQAAAEQLCLDLLAHQVQEIPALGRLQQKVREEASGRLLDWIDHLLAPDSAPLRQTLEVCGFLRQPDTDQPAYFHPGAILPRLVLTSPDAPAPAGVALRVESIADFLQLHRFSADLEGDPSTPFRRARVTVPGGSALLVVERRGSSGYDPTP
ncbi:MAG: hypothetical protein IH614_01615, partial [Desulfuromonadales bacterium]|nr:hypothetical protein [Desulfuromonadales bacterium]